MSTKAVLRRPSGAVQNTKLASSILQQMTGEKLNAFNEFLEAECVSGRVSRSSLVTALKVVLGVDDTFLITQILNGFAEAHSGGSYDKTLISARIFSLQNGSVDDALTFAFKMYDVDNDGKISSAEFKNVLRSTMAAQNKKHTINELWLTEVTNEIAKEWLAERRASVTDQMGDLAINNCTKDPNAPLALSSGIYGNPLLVKKEKKMEMTLDEFRTVVARHEDLLGLN